MKTKRIMGRFLTIGAALLLSSWATAGDQATKDKELQEGQDQQVEKSLQMGTDLKFLKADALKWEDEPSLPAGAKVAVLYGDPSKAAPFALRLKLPANYKIPAHTHPVESTVTVIEGEFNIGSGDKLDPAKATALRPGDFEVTPKGTRHFGVIEEETVLQIQGTGPWGINYVNPADDPRKRAEQKTDTGTVR